MMMKQAIVTLAIVIGACGCSNDVTVTENGVFKCQVSYPDNYEFDTIRTNDMTNGVREVTIILKKVDD